MINELALSIGAVALALLVYRRTGSAIGATAFFLCAEFGPAFISPLLVARLDQKSARRVLPVLYGLESLIFLTLASLVHRFALAVVLALVLLGGSLAVAAGVLVRATWTSITSASGQVRDANALVNTGFSICFMVGPALGGLIVGISGTVAALLVNVAAYALNALLVATATGLPRALPNREPAAGRLRAAAAYARSEPLIRRLLGLQAVGMLFFAISIPVEVVLAQHTLHAGPGGYGALLAAWGAGAIAGSGVYVRWRRLSNRVLITLGTFLLGVGFLLMAVAPTLGLAIAGAVVGGAGNGIQVVSVRTALQEALTERWMALVLSLNESLFQAVPGAGIVVGGAIAALAGPRAALAVGAIGSLAVTLAMWNRLAILSPAPQTPAAGVEGEDAEPELVIAARTAAGQTAAARKP
jgi:predicted MFS family arabinose efflux permease